MSLIDTFKESGIGIEEAVDSSAEDREKELNEKSSYNKMSDETNEDLRDRAVRLGLIPPTFRNAEFDGDKIKLNTLKQQNSLGHKFHVIKFNEYFDVVSGILTNLRMKQLPDKSYLIGAPNGFGKQSFATECLLACLHNGWVTVPYISLLELAQLKVENDKTLMRGLMGIDTITANQKFNFSTGEYSKNSSNLEDSYSMIGDEYVDIKHPEIITGRYSWSEYINAPFMICFFSGIDSKAVESQMLYSLLKIRASKGFPTIATISTSLKLYESDPVLGKHIWREIKSFSLDDKSYSRIYHVSCYKKYDAI